MDYLIGAVVLGVGFLLCAVIALNAAPGNTPAWAQARWLTIPAGALVVASLIWYGWNVLFR